MVRSKGDIDLPNAQHENLLRHMLQYTGRTPTSGLGGECTLLAANQGVELWAKNEMASLRRKMWMSTGSLAPLLEQSSHIVASVSKGSIIGYAGLRHTIVPDTLNLSTRIVDYSAELSGDSVNVTALGAIAQKIITEIAAARGRLFQSFAPCEQWKIGQKGSPTVTMRGADFISRAEVEAFHSEIKTIPSVLRSFSANKTQESAAQLNGLFVALDNEYEGHPFVSAIAKLDDISRLCTQIKTPSGDEVHCQYLERVAGFWAEILDAFITAINQKAPKATLYVPPHEGHYNTEPLHTHDEVQVTARQKGHAETLAGMGTFKFPNQTERIPRVQLSVDESSPSALSFVAASLLDEVQNTQWYKQKLAKRFK